MNGESEALQTDSLAKGIGFLAVANMAQRGVGFLRNLSFCYFLSKTDVGLWALASSFFVLAAPLSVLGMPGCFGRYVETFRQQGQLRSFVKRTLTIATTGLLLFCVGLLAFSSVSGELIFGQQVPFGDMLLLTVTLFSVVAFNSLMELLSGLRQPTAVSQMQMVSSMSFSLLSLPAVAYWPHWECVVVCFGTSMVLGMLPGAIRLKRRCSAAFDSCGVAQSHSFLWRVAPFALTVWITDLLTNLFDVVDRYMLLHWASNDTTLNHELVGQFHTARILPVLFLSLASMLAGLLLPYWSSDWEAKDKARAIRSYISSIKMSAAFFWICSLVTLVGSPLLFGVLFKGKYAISEACLPIALAHCVFAAVAILQCSFMRCIEANRWTIGILLVAFGANVASNWIAVPRLGVSGAMYATLGSTILMVLLSALVLRSKGVGMPRSVCLMLVLPLTLLLPVPIGCAACAMAVFIAGRSSVLITDHERQSLDDAILPMLNRVGVRLETLWPHSSGKANGLDIVG